MFMRWLTSLLLAGIFASATPLQAGQPLVDDFTLKALDGSSHSLADYRGKWVLVNYWATWCPPCLEELPELVLFHEAHHQSDAVVLGINMEQLDSEYLNDFVDSYAIDYPILPTPRELRGLGPVTALPTTFLIDPEGRLVARKVGGVTMQGIEAFIREWGQSNASAAADSQ